MLARVLFRSHPLLRDIPVLFDFNRPERYPELFSIDRRFDPKHLNRTGSREFSELLAEAFAQRFGETLTGGAGQ